MRQCSRCLRFLPNASFSKNRNGLASQCNGCTNQRHPRPWTPVIKPLAQALNHWRTN